MQLYTHPCYPTQWIVGNSDASEYWVIPAEAEGWQARKPFQGQTEKLRPEKDYLAISLGIPGLPGPRGA